MLGGVADASFGGLCASSSRSDEMRGLQFAPVLRKGRGRARAGPPPQNIVQMTPLVKETNAIGSCSTKRCSTDIRNSLSTIEFLILLSAILHILASHPSESLAPLSKVSSPIREWTSHTIKDSNEKPCWMSYRTCPFFPWSLSIRRKSNMFKSSCSKRAFLELTTCLNVGPTNVSPNVPSTEFDSRNHKSELCQPGWKVVLYHHNL